MDSPRLTGQARQDIAEADVVFVSVASAWEAAIKIGLGRLELPEPFETGVADSGFERLPVAFAHAEAILALPHHHRDPFDRMLIAQARVENLTLASGDRTFHLYNVALLAL